MTPTDADMKAASAFIRNSDLFPCSELTRSGARAAFLAGIAHERERAAKVAEGSGDEVGCPPDGVRRSCHIAIAAAIRRGA